MKSNPKSPPRSILFVWMMVIILNVSAVSAVFAAIMVYYQQSTRMEEFGKEDASTRPISAIVP